MKPFICILALVCLFPHSAMGAAISGEIVFEGEPPVMKTIDMGGDPVCHSKHTEPIKDEALVLGEGQTMANILVRVTKGLPAKEYPTPTEPVILTQEGCRYSPHVFATMKGQAIKLLNPDGTVHNIHGFPKVNKEFNKTMVKTMTETTITFDQVETMFRIKCDMHPWMMAFCAVMDNPFYDITATDGLYTIEGLEPGAYEIEAWHERLGTQTAQVNVTPDGAKDINFTFARKK